LLSLAVAFGAGVISITSPCCLPLLPGYLGYLTGMSSSDLAANRDYWDDQFGGHTCGTNPDAPADLDYLIVTAPGRLWTARALTIGLVRLARRAGRRVCPNYLLSTRALALEHGTFQVVVHQGPRGSGEDLEGLDMAAQKALEGLVQREVREEGARPREHHHEAGEGPRAVADPDRPESHRTDARHARPQYRAAWRSA